MKVKDLLKLLNMKIMYKIVDRNTSEVLYDNTFHSYYKRLTKETLDKNIYMIFNSEEDKEKLDIRIF